MTEPIPEHRFPSTHWGRIAAGGDEATGAGEALADLCATSWFLAYAFLRRKGHAREPALDLMQGDFARLLERRPFAAADPGKGRFRTILRADVAFFLAEARDRDAALKRGGGLRFVPLDAEGRHAAEPADGMTTDRLFVRAWALGLISAVVERLRREFRAAGKGDALEALKVALTDDPRAVPSAELGRRLGMTQGAVQVAVHGLRRRCRDLVRAEIAATVGDPSVVEEAILALFAALG